MNNNTNDNLMSFSKNFIHHNTTNPEGEYIKPYINPETPKKTTRGFLHVNFAENKHYAPSNTMDPSPVKSMNTMRTTHSKMSRSSKYLIFRKIE
jgi:hypothetical protein